MTKPILVCEMPVRLLVDDDDVTRIENALNRLLGSDYYVIVSMSDEINSPVFRTNNPDLYSLEELQQIIK